MTIIFPHANNQSISLIRFVAAWKVWFDQYYPGQDWRTCALPRLNSKVKLQAQLEAGNHFSLDVMCRFLASPSYRNTMHATNRFMEQNQMWITPTKTINSRTGKNVNGARLTPETRKRWDEIPDEVRNRQEKFILALLNAEIECNGEVLAADTEAAEELLPIHESILPINIKVGPGDDRKAIIKKLVRWIHTEPYKPFYRKRPSGHEVFWWDNRLRAYFWPSPNTGYAQTEIYIQPILDGFRSLSAVIEADNPWTSEEETRAVYLAKQIFEWGGVSQVTVSALLVRQVMENALHGQLVNTQALMNSGWTKVASFATAHLEGMDGRHPQVIWDSRVSTAIIYRLDRMFADCPNKITLLFPDIGTVLGRGGTRPRPLSARWPSGYGKWEFQFAESKLVAEMRDVLNDPANGFPQMPLLGSGLGRWTMRGVEMVLFGDGY